MNVFSLFVGSVLAFEGIISPLPDNFTAPSYIEASQPTVTFQELKTPSVLGTTSNQNPAPTSILLPLSPTPSPILPRETRQKEMTIAIIGDSMVDTLGPDFAELKTLLAVTYPRTSFTILNYGVGGTNIDYGINRLTNAYDYLGIRHPSLVSQNPDLTIVESFGYNPYSYDIGAIDAHWMAMAKIVDILKANVPNSKIAIAATIAPSALVFGDGAPSIAFSPDDKWRHVNIVKQYLDSTVKFAQSQHIPLIDAYHPSLKSDGNGDIRYINAGDHIHYSPLGRAFVAGIAMDTILKEKLLE
jgi:hypothetical protein